MASFNFVDAASQGYRFIWRERVILSRLALWPVLLKITTLILIVLLGLQSQYTRQGLMLLPAYFLEGWLVAVAIRMAVFGERSNLSGDPLRGAANDYLWQRRQAITGAAVMYLLIKLVKSLSDAILTTAMSIETPHPPPPPTGGTYFLVMFMFLFAVWAFRFIWIYIPVAFGYPVVKFLKKIEAFSTSFHMLGVWIICMVPLSLIFLGLANILTLLFSEPLTPSPGTLHLYVIQSLQAVMDSVLALLSSVSMAFAFREVLSNQNQKKPLF